MPNAITTSETKLPTPPATTGRVRGFKLFLTIVLVTIGIHALTVSDSPSIINDEGQILDYARVLFDPRYFMFFLSPLLLASRWLRRPDLQRLSEDERRILMALTHRVPDALVNGALTTIFAAETPLGHWLPFPWGTSILAILQKPRIRLP